MRSNPWKYCLIPGLFLITMGCSSYQTKKSEEKKARDYLPQLTLIETTGRISGGRYADLTLDKDRNAYIACFKKGVDAQDYLLIAKIDQEGNTVWKNGGQSRGRVMGIDTDPNDHIWVSGYFSDQLSVGDSTWLQPGAHGFLLQLNRDGQPIKFISSDQSALLFYLSISETGQMVAWGKFRGAISFGEVELSQVNPSGDIGFLAYFNQNGQCRWIESFDAEVTQLQFGKEGAFYVGGGFNTRLEYQSAAMGTSGVLDQDAFLAKIDENGQLLWWKQFGKPKIERNGFRTSENLTDLKINSAGNIVALLQLHSSQMTLRPDLPVYDIMVRECSPSGQEMTSFPAAQTNVERMAQALVVTDENEYWITGVGGEYFAIGDQSVEVGDTRQAYILRFDKHGKLQQYWLPDHGNNTIFRAGAAHHNKVFFSGHFQSKLRFESDSLSNTGAHALVLVQFEENSSGRQ